MRFSTILLPVVALSTSVVADGASIKASMATISDSVTSLNGSVTDFVSSGNPLKLLPIIIKSTGLLSDINSATDSATASANLTLTETLDVASATLNLAKVVESVLDNIVAGEKRFSLALVSPIIYLNLQLEKDATDKFAAAVVSKVPESLQGTAAALIAPIDDAFVAALAAYKGKL